MRFLFASTHTPLVFPGFTIFLACEIAIGLGCAALLVAVTGPPIKAFILRLIAAMSRQGPFSTRLADWIRSERRALKQHRDRARWARAFFEAYGEGDVPSVQDALLACGPGDRAHNVRELARSERWLIPFLRNAKRAGLRPSTLSRLVEHHAWLLPLIDAKLALQAETQTPELAQEYQVVNGYIPRLLAIDVRRKMPSADRLRAHIDTLLGPVRAFLGGPMSHARLIAEEGVLALSRRAAALRTAQRITVLPNPNSKITADTIPEQICNLLTGPRPASDYEPPVGRLPGAFSTSTPILSPHLPLTLSHEAAFCIPDPEWGAAIKEWLSGPRVKPRTPIREILALHAAIVDYYRCYLDGLRKRGWNPNAFELDTLAGAAGRVAVILEDLNVPTIAELERRYELPFSLLPGKRLPAGFTLKSQMLQWVFANPAALCKYLGTFSEPPPAPKPFENDPRFMRAPNWDSIDDLRPPEN